MTGASISARCPCAQLTRLQQPREFKIAPPSTMYIDEKLLKCIIETGVMQVKDSVGFDLADRHSDLNTIVSRVIDRWKTVIVSTRSVTRGPQSQLPLNTEDLSPGESPQEQEPQQRQRTSFMISNFMNQTLICYIQSLAHLTYEPSIDC